MKKLLCIADFSECVHGLPAFVAGCGDKDTKTTTPVSPASPKSPAKM